VGLARVIRSWRVLERVGWCWQEVTCLKGLFLPYYHVELLLLAFDCFWLKLPVLLAVVLEQLLHQLFLVEVQVMYLLPAFLEELPLCLLQTPLKPFILFS
jgi:hypothetical protein